MIWIDSTHEVPSSTMDSKPNPNMERTNMKFRIGKRNSQYKSSLAGACSVLLTLCASQCGLAQQSSSMQPAKAAAATIAPGASPSAIGPLIAHAESEENQGAVSSAPGNNGIRIHGHWKFVVHDPDGKLVSTREFENSLITPVEGDFTLTFLLSGFAVSADWAIVLCPQAGSFLTNDGVGFTHYVVCTSGGPAPIAVLLPSSTGPLGSILAQASLCGSACVGGLQEQLNNNLSGGTKPVSFSLIGNYTASQNVTINAVETLNAICLATPLPLAFSNVSPQTCSTLTAANSGSGNSSLELQQFTGTVLNTAQNPAQSLSTGQVLTVTVTISFS
jgi:hypothetical protein